MKPSTPVDFLSLFQSLVASAINLGMFVLVVILAICHRKRLREHWRIGLSLGVAVFLLALPAQVCGMLFFDLDAIFLQQGRPPPAGPAGNLMRFLVRFGLGIGFLIFVLQIGWTLLVYAVGAEVGDRESTPAYPVLRRKGPVRGLLLLAAFAGGGLFGAASLFLFQALGVREGEAVRRLLQMFPGMADLDGTLLFFVTLTFVSAAAIGEELSYRGVLQGWIRRIGGEGAGSLVAASVVPSLLWALLHLANTDAPLLKFGQIFVFGMILAALARRVNLEAAICAHLGLNVCAAAVGFLFPT